MPRSATRPRTASRSSVTAQQPSRSARQRSAHWAIQDPASRASSARRFQWRIAGSAYASTTTGESWARQGRRTRPAAVRRTGCSRSRIRPAGTTGATRYGTPPSCPSRRRPGTALHRLEGLVDLDGAAAGQDGTALGEPGGGVEAVGLQDRVPGHARGGAVAGAAVGGDRPGGAERVAAVGHPLAELAVPVVPGRHDLPLLLLGGRDATALVQQDVVGHGRSPSMVAVAGRVGGDRNRTVTVNQRLPMVRTRHPVRGGWGRAPGPGRPG